MRRLVFSVACLVWLSFAEWRIFQRLLFADGPSNDFVLESVRGVLSGTPVSKSWQHRYLAPLLVSAVGGVRLESIEIFYGVTLLVANVVLFALLRRRAVPVVDALIGVACFGFAHFVLAYKLEYPWDGIDQIVFVVFGAWAAREGKLLAMMPLLLVGAFNHETILYVPLWYLLSRDRKQVLGALASAAAIGGIIVAMRTAFYRGQPDLPGQVFETPAPVIENHVHVAHNLRALLIDNWGAGRAHISVGLIAAIAGFVWLATRTTTRRAAVWSLVVLATIVCFGYVNETRHYLVLIAFWIAYAWRGRSRIDETAKSSL